MGLGIVYGVVRCDQDLFVETIRFQETQRYIKGIKEIFAIYRRLYGRKQ